jgi:hypothetical protein
MAQSAGPLPNGIRHFGKNGLVAGEEQAAVSKRRNPQWRPVYARCGLKEWAF